MADVDRTLLAALAATDALAKLLIEKGDIADAEDVLNCGRLRGLACLPKGCDTSIRNLE
jgi:hypothetical protein